MSLVNAKPWLRAALKVLSVMPFVSKLRAVNGLLASYLSAICTIESFPLVVYPIHWLILLTWSVS